MRRREPMLQIIYIDPQGGDDAKDGSSPHEPLRTMERARAVMATFPKHDSKLVKNVHGAATPAVLP